MESKDEIVDVKKNSDLKAKEEYVQILINEKIYDTVEITNEPADIIATKKNGEIFYFEIKATSTKKPTAWWGVSVTEWMGARNNPGKYTFVLAIKRNGKYEFKKYTPEQILNHSDIPPFRSTFRYHMEKNNLHLPKRKKSIKLTEERITKMDKLYNQFKEEEKLDIK